MIRTPEWEMLETPCMPCDIALCGNGNLVMNKATQGKLTGLRNSEGKKAADVEATAYMSAQPLKPNEESQSVLLRTQVWDSMLTAGLSCKYYQLLAKRRGQAELFSKIGVVVVSLIGVALAGLFPKAWLEVLGCALVPFLFTLASLFLTAGRVKEAQRWIEKWTELYHDTTELWEQIESAWPNIEQFRPKFATLRERLRGFTSTEYDCPNEKLVVEAQKRLHSELNLLPLRMEP